jgi:hypothetical protein
VRRIGYFFLIETLPHSDFIKVVVTIWAIWSARRKAIHESIYQSPLSTHLFVENFLSELEMAKPKQHINSDQTRRPSTRAPGWIAPPPGHFKINVDGAVAREGKRGSAAAVCRSADGYYQGASAIAIPVIFDPATIEAIACREALCLAADLHLNRICIASDCLEVVNSIRDGTDSRLSSIISETSNVALENGRASPLSYIIVRERE